MHRPRRLSSTVLLEHPYFHVLAHDLEIGAGTHRVLSFAMPDWVSIVAVDEAGRFVAVRQHRHGIDAPSLEPAGGLIDAGEEPAASALRELLEETGHEGGTVEPLGWVHPNPALQDNRCHMFFARGVRRTTEPQSSELEHTDVVLLEPRELREALADGRITHALAVVAFARALERL